MAARDGTTMRQSGSKSPFLFSYRMYLAASVCALLVCRCGTSGIADRRSSEIRPNCFACKLVEQSLECHYRVMAFRLRLLKRQMPNVYACIPSGDTQEWCF